MRGCYVGFLEQSPQPLRRREVAQDQVTLIFDFGPPLRVSGPTEPAADRGSFVAAITDTYAITEYEGVSHGLQVDLSPLGAHMLLGVPMHELSALVIPLEDVLGATATLLVERLAEASGWEARFEALDTATSGSSRGRRRASSWPAAYPTGSASRPTEGAKSRVNFVQDGRRSGA